MLKIKILVFPTNSCQNSFLFLRQINAGGWGYRRVCICVCLCFWARLRVCVSNAITRNETKTPKTSEADADNMMMYNRPNVLSSATNNTENVETQLLDTLCGQVMAALLSVLTCFGISCNLQASTNISTDAATISQCVSLVNTSRRIEPLTPNISMQSGF